MASCTLPKSAVDQLRGFISLCKANPSIIHNDELAFFKDYLLSMGASLPPAPKQSTEKKPEPAAAAPTKEEEPTEMEVESEESDVELDMDGVIGDPNPDIVQDMGDPTKGELTDGEQEEFSNKRSDAMRLMSEVKFEKLIYQVSSIISCYNAI